MALPEIDPSRKIKPRNRGELTHPGCCAVCGSGEPERTYVDFGLYYDYEGSIYICGLCFDEAAVLVMGYFTPEQHEELLRQSNVLFTRIAELEAELDNARPILDAVRSLGVNIVSDVPDGSISDPATVEDVSVGTEEQPETTEFPDSEGHSDSSGSKRGNGRTKPVFS